MNPKNRLLAIAVVGAFALLLSSVSAQDIDVSNAGIAKAKKEALAYLSANKPTKALVVPDTFFVSSFTKSYTYTTSADDELGGGVAAKGTGTLKGAGTQYKYNVSNLLRTATLEVATSDTQNPFDLWHNDKEPKLIARLAKPPFAGAVSPIFQKFLDDWDAEVMKAVNLQSDEPAKATMYKLALQQSAYQFTKVAVDFQESGEESTGALPSTGSSGGAGSGAAAGSGGAGGASHASVIHERLMSGIYRRNDRRMNKIERIRARR